MPGPQFLHVQTFSSKAGPAGNSIDQVIDEANREAEFSLHVDEPQPPRLIFGDPSTFKADHEAHVAARGTKVMVKGVERVRAIRKDRHTLCTMIASYPLTQDQIVEGGDDAKAHHVAWEKQTFDFLQEKYGAQLRVVLAHDDEAHPHLHFWILPDNLDADAKLLHPGKAAKVVVEANAKAEGVKDREAVKLGNDALKDAMRAFLDEYFHDVSEPLGMLRDGPKRRRDSREQYKSRLAEAGRNAASITRVADAAAMTDAALSKLEVVEGQQKILRDQIKLERSEAATFISKVMAAGNNDRAEAEEAARQIIDAAKLDAASILANAKDEAEQVGMTAARDAEGVTQAAHEAGFADGKVAGWAAGWAAGMEAARQSIARYRETTETILGKCNQYLSKMVIAVNDIRLSVKVRDNAKSLAIEGSALTKTLNDAVKDLNRAEEKTFVDVGIRSLPIAEDAADYSTPGF
jgi:flagellar biosynthesis/type III secretory pathway protein FliH